MASVQQSSVTVAPTAPNGNAAVDGGAGKAAAAPAPDHSPEAVAPGQPLVPYVTNAPPVYASVAELTASARFGAYGGRYIPETLMEAHEELERVYVACSGDPVFRAELEDLGRNYIGRATPLTHAKRLTAAAGGAQIWLKREDLAHTGSHKINNAIGQVRAWVWWRGEWWRRTQRR
jgi:hypothetical protein